MAVRIPWVLRDPTSATPEEYLWEVNPNEFEMPRSKSITYQSPAASDGRLIAFEGRDEPIRLTYSGVILSEAQYGQMVYWFNKRHPIELEDDLGRTFTIYITSFTASRKRSAQFPWRHEYNGEMLVFEGDD